MQTFDILKRKVELIPIQIPCGRTTDLGYDSKITEEIVAEGLSMSQANYYIMKANAAVRPEDGNVSFRRIPHGTRNVKLNENIK